MSTVDSPTPLALLCLGLVALGVVGLLAAVIYANRRSGPPDR